MAKVAVVLFNLGGPDGPAAVQPFLFNLFNDPAIIGAPQPVRWLLAKLISSRRAPIAREIYQHLGGGSPLMPETKKQSAALLDQFTKDNSSSSDEFAVFIAMRYWHPFVAEAVTEVKQWGADEVVLLPLYPQFSTTTSGSSFKEWDDQARKQGLKVHTRRICCYPLSDGLAKAHGDLISQTLDQAEGKTPVRLLFSAHGLPKKIVEKGDPYQWQVEETAKSVVEELTARGVMRRFADWQVSYQSRVGPLEWIGPQTDDEIIRAGKEKTGLLVVPIAFVSEHSETLVELDIEYGKLAEENGVPVYLRAPTVTDHPDYISALRDMVKGVRRENSELAGHCGRSECPSGLGQCPKLA